MKLLRVLLLTSLVAICGVRAYAGVQPYDSQGKDPHVIVNDPPSGDTNVGLNFTFESNQFGGGAFSFTNTSGENWTTLEILVPAPQPLGSITCIGTQFSECEILSGEYGFFAELLFTGGTGIPNNGSFTIDLGPVGWTPDAQFAAAGNAPEPGSVLLFLTGIAVPWSRRILRSRV